jgi:hypothetical protein
MLCYVRNDGYAHLQFTDIKVTQHPDGKASAKPFFIIYDHQLYAQVDFISLLSTLHLLSRHFCYCVH